MNPCLVFASAVTIIVISGSGSCQGAAGHLQHLHLRPLAQSFASLLKNQHPVNSFSVLPSNKDLRSSGSQQYEQLLHYPAAEPQQPDVQQIHTHELLTSQGLVPIYQNSIIQQDLGLGGGGGVVQVPTAGNNLIFTGGNSLGGLSHSHHHHHAQPIILTGGYGAPALAPLAPSPSLAPILTENYPPAAEAIVPEDELQADITKSVYVFSAPPDPSDYVPRETLSKVPSVKKKHYQVLFINAPSPPPPPQHHVELPAPPELKTLVYVLVKKPQAPLPIKFIKTPPVPSLHPNHPQNKPEVYFIRYKNKGLLHKPIVEEPEALLQDHLSHHPSSEYGAPLVHHHHQQEHQLPLHHPLPQQEEFRASAIDYGSAHQYEPARPPPPYYPAEDHHHHRGDYYQEAESSPSPSSSSKVLSQRRSISLLAPSALGEIDAGVTGI